MIKNHVTKEELQRNYYVVSEYGAVWSFKSGEGRPLKATTSKDGKYKRVTLSIKRTGQRRSEVLSFPVHRLVCIWFHGDAPSSSHVVNHKDFDTMNNHKDNLEWMTQSENVKYSIDNGRGRWNNTNRQRGIEVYGSDNTKSYPTALDDMSPSSHLEGIRK